MCGGCFRLWRRSPAVVSPVRTAVRISTSARPSAAQLGADAGERRLEVGADVVRERLQRRDVDDRRLVGEAARREAGAHQAVERGQERGQRLARAGRRGDQRVPAGADRRPGGRLRFGGRGKGPREPAGDGGMESLGEAWQRFWRGRRRGTARLDDRRRAAYRRRSTRRGRACRGQAGAAKVKVRIEACVMRRAAGATSAPWMPWRCSEAATKPLALAARRTRRAPAPRRRRAPTEPPSPARSP